LNAFVENSTDIIEEYMAKIRRVLD